jgi:uncharacterized lipoprotein YddW (UPF0748 family)
MIHLPRLALATTVAAALCASGVTGGLAAPLPAEVRALWVTRASLTSVDTIQRMVASASAHGFNTLFVQVRGRGDAYYNRGVEVRAPALISQPDAFDPLGETLARARDAGLRVHAWINVNFVSSATELPASREHVIYEHPEWLMVPREIAPELIPIDVRNPEYLGRLARWTRANSASVEGLYVSPIHAGAHDYAASIVADLVRRYAVDGVHLDYVRYPRADFDYSREAVRAFAVEMGPQVAAADRARVTALEALDPYAWPEAYPEEWRLFRQSRLTALVTRLRSVARGIRPDVIVSAAVVPDAEAAIAEKFQDWRTWLDNGFIDALCPMAYTQDSAVFSEQIRAVRALAGSKPVWAGIGAYRLSAPETIANISAARRMGATGVVLFSYDSLVTPPNGPEYLAAVGRGAFSGS